jgi:dienelactone hydrolase
MTSSPTRATAYARGPAATSVAPAKRGAAGMRVLLVAALATIVSPQLALAHADTSAPEDFGSLAIVKETVTVDVGVDARSVEGVVPLMQVDLYAPRSPGQRPVVELSHGICNTKADFVGWGNRLASRGFVVVIPTRRGAAEAIALNDLGDQHGEYVPGVPVTAVSGTCANFDQSANPEDLLRLLRWTIGQGNTPGGFLSAKVDRSRLALAGHSLGGLFAAQAGVLSQSEGPRLSAIVMFDNADRAQFVPPGAKTARQLAAQLQAPTTVIASAEAQPPLLCDIKASPTCILSAHGTFAMLPDSLPRLGLRVNNALHGEAEDPDNDDQTLADPNHQRLFKRYGMAWLECWLEGDTSAAPYLNGTASTSDQVSHQITLLPGTPGQALAAEGCLRA